MVGAVAVYDRDALHARAGGATLRHISDPGVERAGSAGYRGVSEAGAFVRRAAPFAGRDDEPLAADFAAFVDVVNVAAKGHAVVRARLDEAGDEHFGAGRPPPRECRRRDFRVGIIVLLL